MLELLVRFEIWLSNTDNKIMISLIAVAAAFPVVYLFEWVRVKVLDYIFIKEIERRLAVPLTDEEIEHLKRVGDALGCGKSEDLSNTIKSVFDEIKNQS